MLKSRETSDPNDTKRQILVVDDEAVNRDLLGGILRDEYDVLFAADGQTACELIQRNKNTLSLVLLDLIMPVLDGHEVLRRIREDPLTAHIPVIVLTSDQSSEIDTLDNGAIDFIPKPYPNPGVILARVRRTIELCEDRDTIRFTERDPLTGLYNREFFYRYARQFDQRHPDTEMDALVVDIIHFHMINERFGAAFGDGVLRHVGERLRDMVHEDGGIVCRREGDVFLIYCVHRDDYEEMLRYAAQPVPDAPDEGRVMLRMGVYGNVDKTIALERRFDRAKLAADTVRGSVTKTVGYYDREMYERELYENRLVGDFSRALREEQFRVYYQPKFDIRPETPVLSSAEALVRWAHPELGMISPGVFIPLFEKNGLIQELDTYVWKHAAAQLRDWKDRLGFAVPVSVNVSRIDMYDPNLVGQVERILEQYGLTCGELLLEITESAYTEDSGQIIRVVRDLRSLGFQIEMDDFGAGYSSLNMVSTLPIDALKLDMQFIRTAFSEKRETWMLEIMIAIGGHLGVPVIAEGVETAEQVAELKAMGCDIIQGFYFSRPVPADEFERFLLEARDKA